MTLKPTGSVPRTLITLGDPAGIGPEVVAKALALLAQRDGSEPGRWLVLGNRAAFEVVLEQLAAETGAHNGAAQRVRESLMWLPLAHGEPTEMAAALDELEQHATQQPAIRLWGVDVDDGATVELGRASASSGTSAHRAFACALELLALRYARQRREEAGPGSLGGLVTAPLSKTALQLAGAGYLDHTSRLAAVSGRETIMSFVGGGMRVALASVHVPLAEVPGRLAVEPLSRLIVRAATALARYERLASPVRVAVCGLNPHAGEGGLLGNEEAEIITPAIELARCRGLEPEDPLAEEGPAVALEISGPLAADTVFFRAREGAFDVVIAMYHDQALCAVKTLAFHDAVNATLNLPFVRTSPDHGTAYELAGRGEARADSMLAALELARRWSEWSS